MILSTAQIEITPALIDDTRAGFRFLIHDRDLVKMDVTYYIYIYLYSRTLYRTGYVEFYKIRIREFFEDMLH